MIEFKLGKHTIKITPRKNDRHTTLDTKIEVYRKNILGRSKLIKSMKYMPSPALTVQGFFQILAISQILAK